jgi:mono/diheme cytochrome c family protein
MIKRMFSPAVIISSVLLLGAGVVLFRGMFDTTHKVSDKFVIPSFSAATLAGKTAFDANCAACHGKLGTGTDKGPPLVHDIYNPGHHDDTSFHRAARVGTQQHHWRFGNMPPQPQVTTEQINGIVRYIREVQAANGIHYRPHRM